MNMLDKNSLSGKLGALILLAVLLSVVSVMLFALTENQEKVAISLLAHQQPEYQNIKQVAAKAWIIIIFTFAAFFSAEMKLSQPAHPVHYLLIGCALLLFHLLLLAIAEHAGFAVAYIAATLATAALIALYSRAVFNQAAFPPLALSLLLILYGYFYFTISRQEYALLVSSIGLFAILAALMYFTREVDWYSLGGGTETVWQRPEPGTFADLTLEEAPPVSAPASDNRKPVGRWLR